MRPWWRWWFGGRYGRGGLSYDRLLAIIVASAPVSYWIGYGNSETLRRNLSR